MVCWRSRSAGCAHPSERMGWLSLVTASPHLIWNTCPDTDEGAGLADAPQRTHTAWPRIYTIRVYVYVGI